MVISFTASKDAKNKVKHGISLAQAEYFETVLVDEDDSQDYGEVRYNALGWIGIKLHALTFTMRSGVTHVISLRKATKSEAKYYAESF